MQRVSAAHFVRHFSETADEALAAPVVVTRNNRDRLVVSSVEHYTHLLSLAVIATKSEEEAENLGRLLVRVGTRG